MSVKSLGEINIIVDGVHIMSVESLIAVRATCLLDAKVSCHDCQEFRWN